MTRIKTFTRRIIMSILFLAALLTTFQTISGVNTKILINYLSKHVNIGQVSNLEHAIKSAGMTLKFLNHAEAAQTQPSADKAVSGRQQTLEESIDWSQYPAKEVVATGYTAFRESTGKNPGHPEFGITYSGVKVKRDLFSTVAADLNIFPIGTILFIPGYGYGVVADKGGAIKGNKLDLYFETVEDVYNEWGKKTLDVYVVEMGDGNLTEEELHALNEDEAMQVFRQQYIKTERK